MLEGLCKLCCYLDIANINPQWCETLGPLRGYRRKKSSSCCVYFRYLEVRNEINQGKLMLVLYEPRLTTKTRGLLLGRAKCRDIYKCTTTAKRRIGFWGPSGTTVQTVLSEPVLCSNLVVDHERALTTLQQWAMYHPTATHIQQLRVVYISPIPPYSPYTSHFILQNTYITW